MHWPHSPEFLTTHPHPPKYHGPHHLLSCPGLASVLLLTPSSHFPEPQSVLLVPFLENQDELVEEVLLVLAFLHQAEPLVTAVLVSKLLECGPGRESVVEAWWWASWGPVRVKVHGLPPSPCPPAPPLPSDPTLYSPT